jgi:prefoldin subunit 5
MWAAYVFFGLSLVSLPAALSSGNEIVIVSWVAQTFLQLVLLPIIIVGQNIQAKASDERAIATYDDAGAILEETKQIQGHLKAQDATIADLTEQLKKLSK